MKVQHTRLRLSGRIIAMATTLLAAAVFAGPADANLVGSPFQSDDGNLVVDPPPAVGTQDWSNAPNLEPPGIDLTGDDNSYKGGAKHDDVCPAASTGGIPPNKDDLTRLYVAHEKIGTDTFVYIAWQRFLDKDSSASAHMGIEFNQSSVACGGDSANVQRTDGDILVLYDLEGGGKPTLILLKWLTALSPVGDTCKAAPARPCWGGEVNLSAAGYADGEVNRSAPITDPIPDPDATLDHLHQFGEAAINLTDAGIDPGCPGFGRATLGSRSSGNSFVSTQKDFLGPIPIDLSTCEPATISVLKKNANGTVALNGAVFELYEDDGTTTGVLDAGDTLLDECTTAGAGADAGKCSFDAVTGTGTRNFIVHEKTPPVGYTAAPDQFQSVTFGPTPQTFELTFLDTPAPGTINVLKTDDAGTPMNGITFRLFRDINPGDGETGPVEADGAYIDSCTTAGTGASAGTCQFLSVAPGDYWVVEDLTTLPAGYEGAAPQKVNVGLGSSPNSGDTDNLTFVNDRLHRVIVLVCHEGTNTLAASAVTRGATTKNSLAPGSLTGAEQAALCGLGGATFGGISGHPENLDFLVDVATPAP